MLLSLRLAFLVLASLALPAVALADLSSALQAIERRDFDAAVRELAPLAKSGDAEAQYQLGTLYANGDGVPQSYDAAKGLFSAAAAQGNGRARHALDFLADIGVITGAMVARAGMPTAAAPLPAGAPGAGTTPGTGTPVAAAGTPGDLRLQLATVGSEEAANAEARRIARRFQAQLAGVAIAPERYQMADGATVYRVLSPSLAEPQAREICQQIRGENGNCLLIKP